MALNWYVAQTKPNAEGAAKRRLEDQAFKTYLPLLELTQVVRGQVVTRREPLFRSYVFIELDVDDQAENWRKVNSTRSVLRLIPTAEKPVALRSFDIECLQAAEGDGMFSIPRKIVPGASLRVLRGTVAGQVIEALETQGSTVKALWDCLGRRTVVSIPINDVTVLH